MTLVAHGGVAGAVAETLVTLLFLGLGVAVWLGRGGDDDEEGER